MYKNKLGNFCDPIVHERFEIINSLTSVSFFIGGLVYFFITKNKFKSIPFVLSLFILSLSTLFCHGFLPNNAFWLEIIGLNLIYSVFIAYLICYVSNNFKNYGILFVGVAIFITALYFIIYNNLFFIFKNKNYDETSLTNKLLLKEGTFYSLFLLIIVIFGFGYFFVKNKNVILKSKSYIISIIILIILLISILSIWRYSFPEINKNCNNKFPFHGLFHILGGAALFLFYFILNHFK